MIPNAYSSSGHSTPKTGERGDASGRAAGTLSLLVRVPLIVVLLAGIVWNVRGAIADRLASRDNPAALRLAMRLDPANPAYPAQLAWDLQVADPLTAQFLLHRAVRLNPYNSGAWISLGLLEEEQGNIAPAEADLLRAAAVDVTWMPSWSLANFYFRRQRWEAFWLWAQKAAQMVPDDVTPLLRLAWYVAPDEPEMQDRLRIRRPEVQRQFLWFLITRGDATAVAAWGNRALTPYGAASGDDVLSACEWLMQHQHPDLALPLWNGLAARHQIPFPALEPGSGDAVTNGGFGRQPLSRGFDWRLTIPDGVDAFASADPPAFDLEFSGRESESFLLLSQVVPVLPEKPYTLFIQDASSDLPPGSGLELVAAETASGKVLARTTGFAGSEQQSQVCFTTRPSVRFVTLMLDYQRQLGTIPLEGRIAIRKISLVPGLSAACDAHPATQPN
jgi:hypothetical protein